MNNPILGAVVAALESASEDVLMQAASTLSYRNVKVHAQVTNCVVDGSLELNCRLRVETAEGPAGQANCWVLNPRFWSLFDPPPVLAWLDDASDGEQLLQCTGQIGGELVTINLWRSPQGYVPPE